MANTYSDNVGLAEPATNDTGWGTTLNTNMALLDALAPVGNLAVRQAEIPSASLNVRVAAGTYRKSDGTLVAYAGTSSQAVTSSNTNYVYLTDAGVLTVNTTGWPAAAHVRLATVVAGVSTLTSVADQRVAFPSAGVNLNTVYLTLAGGTFADAGGVVTVGCGSTNGTKFGASAADKIGFYGAAPVVQPSGSAQAALTNSTGGTASTTVNDVGASFSQATLNNNFATVLNLLGALRAALVSEGLIKGSA